MTNQLEKEKAGLQKQLIEQLDLCRELTDKEIEEIIEEAVLNRSRKVYMTVKEKQILKKELYNAFRKLDVLSGLLENEDISEIMINGPNHIFIEQKGVLLEVTEVFTSEDRLRNVIQQIVSSCNRIVNETVPIVDARLTDGSRVNVVLPPVALDGAVMTIRKFPKEFFTMDKLIAMHSITEEQQNF